jgi:hypothetical protein
MTIIKFPAKYFTKANEEPDGNHEDSAPSLSKLLSNICEKTLKDLDVLLRSRTGVEKGLPAWFEESSSTFYKLSMLTSGLRHVEEMRSIIQHKNKLCTADSAFISTADRIAYIFEDMKSLFMPSYDIESAFRVNIRPGSFIPKIISEKYKVQRSDVSFGEMERMIRRRTVIIQLSWGAILSTAR